MSLKNKATVVTGGNGDIGKVMVLELAGQGANLAIENVSHGEANDQLEKQMVSRADQAIGIDGRMHEDWALPGNIAYCLSNLMQSSPGQ